MKSGIEIRLFIRHADDYKQRPNLPRPFCRESHQNSAVFDPVANPGFIGNRRSSHRNCLRQTDGALAATNIEILAVDFNFSGSGSNRRPPAMAWAAGPASCRPRCSRRTARATHPERNAGAVSERRPRIHRGLRAGYRPSLPAACASVPRRPRARSRYWPACRHGSVSAPSACSRRPPP